MRRRTCFPSNRFTVRHRFHEYKEEVPPEPMVDDEPVMVDKQQIIDDRVKLKEKNIKQREKVLPGAKLLKKLHKQSRLEDSLVRVVKNLSIH